MIVVVSEWFVSQKLTVLEGSERCNAIRPQSIVRSNEESMLGGGVANGKKRDRSFTLFALVLCVAEPKLPIAPSRPVTKALLRERDVSELEPRRESGSEKREDLGMNDPICYRDVIDIASFSLFGQSLISLSHLEVTNHFFYFFFSKPLFPVLPPAFHPCCDHHLQ